MTFTVKGKQLRKVLFKRRAMTRDGVHDPSVDAADLTSSSRITEIFDSDELQSETSPIINSQSTTEIPRSFLGPTAAAMSVATASLVPDQFITSPPIEDDLETETSYLQNQTIQECLPFLSGLQPNFIYNEHGVAHLDRKRHVEFIHRSMKPLPAAWVAADASRPWMFYWAMAALSIMGEDVTTYRQRIISTVRPMQNASGGFGGGHGQMSHLAPTYAILLSLAMVGGDEALDLIDRRAMWKWLSILKQEDGGFQMSVGGEEDVRGAYCAAVIITLLGLPLELWPESPAKTGGIDSLLDKLPEWVARCQTFEGGISGRPDAEAHGAYAFCALACLCILGEPQTIMPQYLDVPQLISWLSARQYAPEGGFAGRTNKLVDGCYSHWVGGCWPLIEACLEGSSKNSNTASTSDTLYSREGLIRYILCCCQDLGKRGGLRDKPSHTSDAYHTCYVLAGLSSAQHKWHFKVSESTTSMFSSLDAPYHWLSKHYIDGKQVYDEVDRVRTTHPVFVIPEGVAERTRDYFASKGGF